MRVFNYAHCLGDSFLRFLVLPGVVQILGFFPVLHDLVSYGIVEVSPSKYLIDCSNVLGTAISNGWSRTESGGERYGNAKLHGSPSSCGSNGLFHKGAPIFAADLFAVNLAAVLVDAIGHVRSTAPFCRLFVIWRRCSSAAIYCVEGNTPWGYTRIPTVFCAHPSCDLPSRRTEPQARLVLRYTMHSSAADGLLALVIVNTIVLAIFAFSFATGDR